MYVLFETKVVTKVVVDKERENRLKEFTDNKQLAQDMIEDAQRASDEYKEEQATILNIQAQFAEYLNANAILPYNDSFKVSYYQISFF